MKCVEESTRMSEMSIGYLMLGFAGNFLNVSVGY